MTTPNEELISMLRAKGCPDWVTARWLMESAADLLQSQAERIKELESEVEMWKATANAVVDFEKVQLRAEIAAIAATEPVAKLKPCKEGWFIDLDNPPPITGETIELFTHPMPAESKDAERYRWLRDYLISPSTHFDDLIVSADKADTLDGVIDEALMAAAKAREPA